MVKEQNKEQNEKKDMGWIKTLLNNTPLLKWVKTYSADNLLSDNALVEKLGVKCGTQSISVADDTLAKVLATDSTFEGKVVARFSVAQLKPIFDNFKKELEKGELLIVDNPRKDMVFELKEQRTIVVVCPLAKSD